MNLGERYKDLRLSVKDESGQSISIKEFAANCVNLQAPRISELENNKREMSLTELKAYHEYFKVSFEYLMGETDVKTMEADIQIACKTTGLHEDAIKMLIAYREPLLETEKEKETIRLHLEIISNFLSSGYFAEFCQAFTLASTADTLTGLLAGTIQFHGITDSYDQVESLRLWVIHEQLKRIAEKIIFDMCGGADNGKC